MEKNVASLGLQFGRSAVFPFNVWRKEKNMEIRARPKGLIFVLIYKERETKQ